jgi:hypothetical protein
MVAANTNRPVQQNLETLERLLQHTLQMDLLYVVPLQVECRNWQDILVVVVQHVLQITPNGYQVFHLLEQTIKGAGWSVNQQVQIYLRIDGEKEPYADYTFLLPRPVNLMELGLSSSVQAGNAKDIADNFENNDLDQSANLDGELDELNDLDNLGNLEHELDNADTSGYVDPHAVPTARPLDLDALMRGEPQPKPREQVKVEVHVPPPANAEALAQERLKRLKKRQRAKQMPLILTGLAGVILGAGMIGFVVLGRPCVLGKCEAIARAKQLSEKSQLALNPLSSGKEVLLAQKELEMAIATLQGIPFWSSYYKPAQADLKTYVAKAQTLEQIIIALKQAAKASDMAQKLPIPEPQWQEIQQIWRESIAQLESIPKDAPTFPLAQKKLTQYKENLRAVNLRLAEEQQAVKALRSAKETADIAQTRQGVAQFLSDWQEVTNNWRNGLARLEEIPATTTTYTTAQELKQSYTAKWQFASDRTQQEQTAQKFFDQANKSANAAQKFGSENQWTLAMSSWQNALDYIQQVQPNTSAAARTPALIQSYNNSLKQAQANLNLATIRQKAKIDLDRTCNGNPPICSYEVVDNLIRVRLAASYTEQLRQTAIVATVRGDSKTHAGVIQHVNTLQKALQAISQNNRLGLEIYDANGYLISAYTP